MVDMYDPILAGIVRILNTHQQVIGTGFLISHVPQKEYGLIATSTRTIERATSLPIEASFHETVPVIFQLDSSNTVWNTSMLSWSSSNREDVSILQVEGSLPKRVRPLSLSLATALDGRKVSLFGYPTSMDNFLGEWRYCDICRPGPKQVKTAIPFLQLDSPYITDGYSGAPVWDDERHKVIGLVTQTASKNQQGNAFAAPIEVLRSVYNDIEVTIPSPYHGLTPFSESEAVSFFGYDDTVNKMAQKLHDEPRFLAVLGSIGSGKSSAVQAGLIPKLQHGEVQGYEEWGIFFTRLSDNPFQQLEAEGLEEASTHLSKGLHTWSQRHRCQRIVLILDQFEVFLQCAPEDIQQRFVKQLLDVIHEGATTLILILKDEFYSLLAKHEALMEWVEQSLVNVFAPHTKEELLNIAKKRAKTPGTIQNLDLIEKIIEKIFEQKQPDNRSILGIYELSQMQVTLYQAQASRLGEAPLATDQLLDFTAGDLDSWAETVYDTLDQQQQAFAQRLFTQVVLLGDETSGTPDTGRKIQIAALCQYEANYEVAYNTVYDLADKGLLVTSRDRSTGYEIVTIAQDTLIQQWQRLRDWLHDYRKFLLWLQDFQLRVAVWAENATHNEDDLLEGFALTEAEMWLTKRVADFDQLSQNFIRASQQQKQQQESFSEETERQQKERVQQHLLAQARQLAGQAMVSMQHPLQVRPGIEMAVEALSYAHCPEADRAIRHGLHLLSHPITCISVDDPFVVAFSYDGQYTATAYNDLYVDIMELATGQLRCRLPHRTPVTLMAFDPTTTYLVTVSRERMVTVWNVSEGRTCFSYHEASCPTLVKFSLDGRYLAVVNCDKASTLIKVWEVSPWRHHAQLHEHEYINAIDFNHDNTLLATGDNSGVVKAWDIARRKALFAQQVRGSIRCIAFSPGGQYLAIGSEQGVAVLAMTSLVPFINEGHKASVRSLLFSPQGNYLASGSDDRMVRIWDIPSGHKLAQLPHNASVRAVAFSFDSTSLATLAEDQIVRIWELNTYQEVAELIHEQPIWSMAFSMNKRYLFTLSHDHIIRVWHIIKSRHRTTLACHAPVVAIACFEYNDFFHLTASCVNHTIWQWHIALDNELSSSPLILRKHACSLAYSSDGQYLATASTEGEICIWHVQQAREIASFPCKSTVIGVSFCRDNQYLMVTGKEGSIHIWNWATQSIHSTAELNGVHPIEHLAVSPNEHHLGTIENNGSARIWVWRVSGIEPLFNLPHTHAMLDLCFSPDGQTIATISRHHSVYLWDITNGSRICSLNHANEVLALTFSPDGQYLATASADQRVNLWEIATGHPVSELPVRTNARTVVFSSDGTYVTCGSNDGLINIWRWRPEDLIHEAFIHMMPDLAENTGSSTQFDLE